MLFIRKFAAVTSRALIPVGRTELACGRLEACFKRALRYVVGCSQLVLLAALECCVGLLWDTVSWWCWQPWSVVSVCCGMQSVGDAGSLGVLCRFALNRSFTFWRKRRLQTQRQETCRKERTKIGHGGEGGGCCEINNRTIIRLDATRCRAERRCWVSYRHCYMLRDAAVCMKLPS